MLEMLKEEGMEGANGLQMDEDVWFAFFFVPGSFGGYPVGSVWRVYDSE